MSGFDDLDPENSLDSGYFDFSKQFHFHTICEKNLLSSLL